MANYNIQIGEKVYKNGDALDCSVLTLDVFHHVQILNGLRLCVQPGGVYEAVQMGRAPAEVEYAEFFAGKNQALARINYGEALQLTDLGREKIDHRIRFCPALTEIESKPYAILDEYTALVLKCPGIIWHDGHWCAPCDQLDYHDGAMWCDTVFAPEE